METEKRLRKGDLAALACIALAGVPYYYAYYAHGLKLLDEGYLLDPVMRVLNGDVPYRDFHHFYAPGRFYLFAGLFGLTGPDILATRVFWAVLNVMTACTVYVASRRFSSPAVSLFAAAVALLCPGVWHKGFFVLFAAAGAWVVALHAETRTVRTALLCGAMAGAAFIFRQDIAVYIALSFLLTECWCAAEQRSMSGLALRIGASAVVASFAIIPMLVYFAYEGALSDMLGQMLFAGRTGTAANSLPFPELAHLLSGGAAARLRTGMFYLPFVVYLSGGVLLAAGTAGGRRGGGALFGLLAFGLLVSLQVMNRSDSAHLWQIMPPVLVAGAALVERLKGRFRGTAPYLAGVLFFGFMVAAGIGDRTSGSIAEMKGNDTRLEVPRARVYVPGALASAIQGTLEDINRYTKDDPYGMLAAPDIPIMYFLAGKRNPTSHELFRAGIASGPGTQGKLVGEIESRGVRLVVYNRREVNDGRPERLMKSHSPELYGYIMDNFRPVAGHGIFELRLKNEN